MNSNKIAFLDRDGVINYDYGYVHDPRDFSFQPRVFEGCKLLQDMGFRLIIVTNQSGIGRGYYSTEQFNNLCKWMIRQFRNHGVSVLDIFFCPHHPTKGIGLFKCECPCRKPKPGMLIEAQKKWIINMSESVMIGDKPSDMKAALSAKVGTRILVDTNGENLPLIIPECTYTAKNLYDAATLLINLKNNIKKP